MKQFTPYPSWFDKADPQKQLAVMRQYLSTLINELTEAFSEIRYEDLDPSLRARFDSIDENLANVQRSITTTDENINQNYTREADLEDLANQVDGVSNRVQILEDDHVTIQNLYDVSNRVSNIEDANYQGQIDSLDGRIDDLEAIDAGIRLNVLEEFEPKAVTTENTETIIADKNLKVASIKIGNNTYTEQTATISGTTIHFLGY